MLFRSCKDIEVDGKPVLASRLGYRITSRFVNTFFGRLFNHPHVVLADDMLRPELQDPAEFADAVSNVVETHRRVAGHYFDDGSVADACPPLKALLHVMRDGHFEGRPETDPAIRELFTRDSMLGSAWYKERLRARQHLDLRSWRQHSDYLARFVGREGHADESVRLGVRERLARARAMVERVKSPSYIEELAGTTGGEPAIARATGWKDA